MLTATIALAGLCAAALLAVLRRGRAAARRLTALQQREAEGKQRIRALDDEVAALRAEQAPRAKRSAALAATLQHIDQGVMMVDPGGTVVVYNDRVADMLELPKTLLASRPAFQKILEYQWKQEEFSRTNEALRRDVRAGGLVTTPRFYERERPNGTTIEVRTQQLPGGEIVRTFTDITDRKRAQTLIERAALFDELTGLPSRLALQKSLSQDAGETARPSELLYLNLDRFRLLNDARGHDFGDRVLVEVAKRLREACTPEQLVSRVGGDEFAVVHPDEGADGESLPDRLLELLAEPLLIDGSRLSITTSIGVVSVQPGDAPSTLLRNADTALNRAKDAGRNQACRYTPSMTAARQERFQIEQSLRASIGTGAFRLAYQPVVAVESGSVIGYEALLRWTDRARGEVPPATFIPVAEATGLILPLGRAVLQWACAEAATWPTARTVAVNLSPAQFVSDDIVEAVKSALALSRLEPSRLELEVTEGMLLENSAAVLQTMRALRDLGVRLTLDDFGAGHAGLSYLRRFPFEKMKIDGSFIRTLGCDRESDAIVEAILLLGRRLDMSVVAEGVETTRQLEQLREMRCPLVQGYLTGRPMTPEKARVLQL